MITIGYAATRAKGLQMLAEYNNNPFDTKAAKMTFSDVYEEWSKRKYPNPMSKDIPHPIKPAAFSTTKFLRIFD